MDLLWPDCPHPQCDARNPPEALYCARCGRPQYQSPGWQEHAVAKAKQEPAKSTEGAQVVIWIVVILFGFVLLGITRLFVRN